MTISKDLLDELLSGVDRPEDLLGEPELRRLLEADITQEAAVRKL